MSRRARPWYRRGRSMWYVQHDGTQHPLGVRDPADRAAAEAAHQQLLDQLAAAVAARLSRPPDSVPGTLPPAPPTNSPGQTVGEAVVAFLAAAEKKVGRGKMKAKTAYDYRLALAPFGAAFGGRPLGDLLPEAGCEEVEDWAAGRGWSVSTQNTYLGTVQTLFKWAGLRLKVRRPPKQSRGAKSVRSDEQFAAVLAALKRYPGARGDLAELLTVLRQTGARPSEVSGLTVEGLDWAADVATLTEHKTRHQTGEDRLLVFTDAALAVLRAQRDRYGAGLLFRTRAGGRYTAAAIGRRLRAVSKRLGYRTIAYGERHGFATRALEAGVPDADVAGLLGHKGTTMLHRHYAHLTANARRLKAAAERVSKAG